MLVFDEVQCGVARTGQLYAYQHYDVVPDIMATAKGIGGGFPMGACLATEKAAAGMVIGTHGSTYRRQPAGDGGGAGGVRHRRQRGVPRRGAAEGRAAALARSSR